MKKLIVLMFLVMALALMGCGGGTNVNVTSSGGDSSSVGSTLICAPDGNGVLTCTPGPATTASAKGGTVTVNTKTDGTKVF